MVVLFPVQSTLPECEDFMGVELTVPYAVREIDMGIATLMDELLARDVTDAQLDVIRQEAQRCWLSLAAVELSALGRMGKKRDA
jgi:hypothetical protein